jgi:acyl CoA:acetate/3-ketoacid CoA transferase
MEREALTLEALAIAMAARNSGGIVIAQVERMAERGTLHPRQVKVPGVLVDAVVVATDPAHHMQTFSEQYNPAYSGEIRLPMDQLVPMPMSERKVIARRAALELKANSVVNLGIGMPEGVAAVAAEERVIDLVTLTAGDLAVELDTGKVRIASEGTMRKFVKQVEHRTFSGREARRRGQRVLYVTERCVFRLAEGGLELVEIAPGIDLEREVLAQMDFMPAISPDLKLMDAAVFALSPLGLRERLLAKPLHERFELDREHRLLFINFEGLAINSQTAITEIEQAVTHLLEPVGQRVAVVVNYDNFSILPGLVDEYSAMVTRLTQRFYSRVTRYGTGGFLKAKLDGRVAA